MFDFRNAANLNVFLSDVFCVVRVLTVVSHFKGKQCGRVFGWDERNTSVGQGDQIGRIFLI
jgi:hypothetical protein